ncbi:MAG: hypothetical protein KGH53_03015 [Candidatus Micrarchaeota archaeon]|nr:hypothetical protein [Candidatus Micrarchaeota archaeon]
MAAKKLSPLARTSSTAVPLAYLRSFSDEPFAKEISDATDAKKWFLESYPKDGIEIPLRAASLEARGKGIDRELKRSGAKMILELASGVSTRGLKLSADPAATIVQSDLQPIVGVLEVVVRGILKGNRIKRENLHFCEVNALNYDSIADAAMKFETPKISVVTEGLLNHMSLKEKDAIISNIHSIIGDYGGVWVSSDMYTKQMMRRMLRNGALTKEDLHRLHEITGRSMYQMSFDEERDIKKTMRKHGFEASKHSVLAKPQELTTLKLLKMEEDEAIEFLEKRSSWLNTWVMVPK